MDKITFNTKEEVLAHARKAIGIPLGKIDKTGRLATGKGAIGTVLEESWFDIKPNNESEPDFPEAGVELKATPYVRKAVGIRAKERLVCNIINYMEEHSNTFLTSSFWTKCSTILLMSYEHIDGIEKGCFTIDEVVLYGFPKEDLGIIMHDWAFIISKIRAGKAHELSEGDTMYLGACTKGATSASVRRQPFSDVPAKQRAYSLKQSYMTYVLNSYVYGNKTDERIIKDPELLRKTGFEKYLLDKIAPFIGRKQKSLLKEFGIMATAKNANEIIISRILGIRGRLSETYEFQKANIIPKTIRIQMNGRIKEHMSFPTFRFTEIINEEWEESTLKNYLEPTKFLFVIFKEYKTGKYIFERIMFWNIPVTDLDEVRVVWERTVQIINNGVKLQTDGNRVYNNLPKATENRISHVRPHARNADDTYPLPDGRHLTKQCFWLNNTYIESIVKG